MSEEPTPFDLAVSAFKSMPQWDAFIQEFKDRREQWITDTRNAAVYQSHPELVHVTARIAENDHWLERLV